jgi:serine/threonine protein kinase
LTPLELPPGTVFGEDFKVLSPLSRGGMGAVYVVEQLSTQKRRALKLMLAARASDPEMRKRFEQEAKVGAMIPSEHVVDVIAAGIDAKSQIPWLAMELLDGEDLESFADRRGQVTPSELYEIFAQLCHALAAAHAIPIVHRDLKPGNIFLARPRLAEARPIVKVLDFGIAKIVGAAPSTTAALGTPLWMAPEQSEPRAPIHPAADVWALGLIAFRLLTGRLYWISANDPDKPALSVVREVLFEPLVSATERAASYGVVGALPAGFDGWFARCVTRDLAARFADAGAAWRALQDVLSPGRATLASNSGLSDVRASVDAQRRHREGLASTLMATPSPGGVITGSPVSPRAASQALTRSQPNGSQPLAFPPPSGSASATLDAVGQTLAREGEPSVRLPTHGGRAIVIGLVALVAVLAIGAGAFVLLRGPTPRVVASTPAESAPTPPAASAPPITEPSAAAAPSATSAASTTTTKPTQPGHALPPPHGAAGAAGATAKPSATAAPPPPPQPTAKPTATTPFLL